MKELRQYILEELDDNYMWMIDKWFEMNPTQLPDFIGICVQCKNDRVPSVENIEKYLKDTAFGLNLSQFIDWVNNDIIPPKERNDLECLKIIIKQILSNKNPNNKYLHKG